MYNIVKYNLSSHRNYIITCIFYVFNTIIIIIIIKTVILIIITTTIITRRSVEHCTPHADGAWLNELGWSQ